MASAMILIRNKSNTFIKGRALLDTCSTANFITEKFARRLNLPMQSCSLPIAAINSLGTTSRNSIEITFKSIHNQFQKTLLFLTIPKIAESVPSDTFPRNLIKIPHNIKLADPEFHVPRHIDLLIGAGASMSLLSVGQINLSQNNHDLYLQKTLLGWVIAGELPIETIKKGVKCNVIKTEPFNEFYTDLNKQIEKFWVMEDVGTKNIKSKEDLECEKYYLQSTTRDSSGRYTVRLPFRISDKIKPKTHSLGDSYNTALRRFYALENKFSNDPDLKLEYSKVIQEYLDLGHMSISPEPCHEGYYLPHHAVVKDSVTTKVRVVFDASAETSTGLSLNKMLMIGPTIQDKLCIQLIKFRNHKYVLTADIEKMYRQINIHEEDRKYQRIIWRDKNKIQSFQLNTVTFGVSSSPYLAIRTIHKLADDEKLNYPIASRIIKNDLYVDDLLSGANTIDNAKRLREEITGLLEKGKFNIRQWASNDERILEGLTDKNLNSHLILDKDCTLKTLGISWNTKQDHILYNVKSIEIKASWSKRNILSEIAKIFDPLGLLGPVIMHAKLIMQLLWQCKINWDESVPLNIITKWNEFITQLNLLKNITINRRLLNDNLKDIQIHGFCDASKVGYGACLYIRMIDKNDKINCRLICAKSRVAPLKEITIPRLELAGAVLLTKLYEEVKIAFNFPINRVTFWSDSMIVLYWLKTESNQLKTFVANRINIIQESTKDIEWRHVRGENNPADAISRGQLPKKFIHNFQWFHGPEWLKNVERDWPDEILKVDSIPELKTNICLTTMIDQTQAEDPFDLFKKCKTYSNMKRIIAYGLRFSNKMKGLLQLQEINIAEQRILKRVQELTFHQEIKDIKMSKFNNKIAALNPFLDEVGLLRVGGRLKNSQLLYTQKHPILLPSRNPITDIIIHQNHIDNAHSGIMTTLYALRKKFWIFDGRNQVRKVIKNCNVCFRFNPTPIKYKMGDLPSVRVNEATAFSNTGIDFCGPFFIKEKKFRNRGRVKVYVCVFICMVIKAIHLEVVSDLTTEGFLAAFRRFAARRGVPDHVYSDNGTNFIGANNQLKELYELFNSNKHKYKINRWANDHDVVWHFIPPLAPHFGGLWESTVKLFKHHFKRVIGELLFTFEEINTFVTEIEGILNSRPLTSLSSDPNDISALTPSHYLIGKSQRTLPEHELLSTPSNRLSKWQHITKVRQDFWNRWSQEYLNELHQRKKWVKDEYNLEVNTIVLIKDKGLPCLKWLLGRVIEVHPGSDGIVRAATVKTATGQLKRPVNLLCPLPFENTLKNVSPS